LAEPVLIASWWRELRVRRGPHRTREPGVAPTSIARAGTTSLPLLSLHLAPSEGLTALAPYRPITDEVAEIEPSTHSAAWWTSKAVSKGEVLREQVAGAPPDGRGRLRVASTELSVSEAHHDGKPLGKILLA
jgi:hypothetical protein